MIALLLRFQFSKHSKANDVPRLLKQGRFTHQGYKVLGTNRYDSKNWIERRFSKIRRPVDLSYVDNPQYFYDHQAYVRNKKEKYQDRKEQRLLLLKDAPPLDYILSELNNEQHLRFGTWQVLFALKLLHKHYPKEINDVVKPQVLFALNRLNLHVRDFDIHNFRSLVSFAEKYYSKDQDVWRNHFANTVRIILSNEQQQTPLLASTTQKQKYIYEYNSISDVKKDFLLIFHKVVSKALEFEFQLDDLITQLDLMMRNHYRGFKAVADKPGNSFENLTSEEAAIFFSDFIQVMLHRKDFYNPYDKVYKTKQIEEIAQVASKVILKDKKELSNEARVSLKEAFIAAKDTQYFDKELKQYVAKI